MLGSGRLLRAAGAIPEERLTVDVATATGGRLEVEISDGDHLHEGYVRILQDVARQATKPVVLATNLASNGGNVLQGSLARLGQGRLLQLPVIPTVEAADGQRTHVGSPGTTRT